ncbi:MAG: putative zinc-binding protein [Promethearchaeati archaeon]
MTEKLCVLPCNGLDKSLGVIARNVALKLNEKKPEIEIVCPVSLNRGDEKYEEIVEDSKVLVIDGCMTRCATDLIEEREEKIFKRIFIPDMIKKFDFKPGTGLVLNQDGKNLINAIVKSIIEELEKPKEKSITKKKFEEIEYFKTTIDKYHFRVPKEGYFFNENDCWIKPEGDTALMGITDYLQNKASDILFVDLPEIGKEIEQFDDVGSFESTKTVLQLISPGSGKVINVNRNLEDSPELMNQDPYEQGWFLELELRNFEEDKQLVMNGTNYFNYMKNKAEKESRQNKDEN